MEQDITVTIHHGLDTMDINLIQEIEMNIDKALAPIGYARVRSSKSCDKVEFHYYQFATVTRKG